MARWFSTTPPTKPDTGRRLASSARLALLVMVILLLITAAFRFERLMTIPPGMHGDLAQYISDGMRISRAWSFPLSLDSRPEPLWRWVLGVLVWWTGAVPFTEKFGGIAVGLLTVAVTYRATLSLLRLWRWTTPLAQRLGAFMAATAISANVGLEFINREGFRAGMLPLAIAVLFLLWARAFHKRTWHAFALAGLASGFTVNTYTAGLFAPPVALGALLYLAVLGKRGQRPGWRNGIVLVVAMLIAASPQIYLYFAVPDLYGHVRQMQVGDDPRNANAPLIPPLPELAQRLNTATRAYYATGYYALNYNTPDTPFLNPALAMLAALGILAALWTWRQMPGVLVGAMLVAMTFPGALSKDPNDTVRLCGSFVPLAVLAGLGTAALIGVLEWLAIRQIRVRFPVRPVIAAAALFCIVVSPTLSRAQFDAFWLDSRFWEKPDYWLSFPHYFSINFTDYLTMLQRIDRPAYVPLPQLDSPTGSWYLMAQAYPNIRALDIADPLTEAQGLPDADLWYPYAAEYNVPLPEPAQQFGLLLPGPNGRNGTIVILPPVGVGEAETLRRRAFQSKNLIIDQKYGWRLGWRLSVRPSDVTSPARRDQWHEVHARFADAIELIGYEAPQTLTPGQTVRTTLYWRALRPIGFDAFSYAQFLATDNRPFGTTDAWLFRWMYPSVFWKPDEILADVRMMTLAKDMPNGAYRLAVGIYTEPRQVRAAVLDRDDRPVPDNWLTLQNHRVPLPALESAPADAVTVQAIFGGSLSLSSYKSDKALVDVKAGDTVQIRQYWHAVGPVVDSYTLFVHVLDSQGKIIAQRDVQPFDGRYPTNVWAVGEPIMVDVTLAIPADAPSGPYEWRVGAYSYPSLERLPVRQGDAQPADRLAILR